MSTKLIECTLGVKYGQCTQTALCQAAPCITSMGISKNAIGLESEGHWAVFTRSHWSSAVWCWEYVSVQSGYQQMLVITGGETSFLTDYSLLLD